MAEASKSFGQAMSQVGQFFTALSVRQRVLLATAAVVVVGTLFIFVRLMAKPEMKPLYSGMAAADAQALTAKLAAKNFKYETSPDGGTVLVRAEDLDKARLEVASDGMPHSGRLGFELFDKPNWGGSDFSEKVNYQRALEGELERTIQTLRNVEACRVHLVLPAESIFTDREREAKASVILKLRNGRLDGTEHVAIAQLVAGAVERLRPENVTVVDADTNRPLETGTGESGGSKLEEQLAQRLLLTLEPITGIGRIRANVRIEHDSSSSEENQETYDPNTTVALTMQRSEERTGASMSGGIPGTASNVPGASGSATTKSTDGASQSSKTENGTYAVNRVVRRTVVPAGRMRRITAALVVDDAFELKEENGRRTESHRKRTPEELKQIEEVAKASIGFDAARGDQLTVQNLTFQPLPVEAPAQPTPIQRVQLLVQQWSSVLRYAGMVLLFAMVYVLMFRPLKKQLTLSFQQTGYRPELRGSRQTPLHGEVSSPTQLEGVPTENDEHKLHQLTRQLSEKAKADPSTTGKLLQTWIREGGLQ